MSELLTQIQGSTTPTADQLSDTNIEGARKALADQGNREQLYALRDAIDQHIKTIETQISAVNAERAAVMRTTVARLQFLRSMVMERLHQVDPMYLGSFGDGVNNIAIQPVNTGMRNLSGYMGQEGAGPAIVRTSIFGIAAFAIFKRPIAWLWNNTIGRLFGGRGGGDGGSNNNGGGSGSRGSNSGGQH